MEEIPIRELYKKNYNFAVDVANHTHPVYIF